MSGNDLIKIFKFLESQNRFLWLLRRYSQTSILKAMFPHFLSATRLYTDERLEFIVSPQTQIVDLTEVP